ncbi:hypothetical protein FS842_003874 [Serendipita sp. 407]|nr:hypothetical protein FS842_003874 [Serendipita sp. 407]
MLANRAARTPALRSFSSRRLASTDAKVVVVGAGTAGLTAASQLQRALAKNRKTLAKEDFVIIDPAEYHYYQPGWTLVGSGLMDKKDTRRPMASLVPAGTTHIPESVKSFAPEKNEITLENGDQIKYEYLVVASGIQINWSGIKGLQEALVDSHSGVSSIYSYATADKARQDIEALRSGKAIFTQPSTPIKCAGGTTDLVAKYDGYTSCPLLTGKGQLLLAEFKYGLEPKESFSNLFDQGKPQSAFYYLKTTLFPWAYFEHMLQGRWYGPKGFSKPSFS